MSDLNFNYTQLKEMTASQRKEFNLSNVRPSKDDDLNLNQSIFKAYLETLKEKSDEATKKTLQEIQNTPITAIGRLFGNLQVNSAEQVSKIFEDLRIKPTDEIDTILGAMQTKVSEKASEKAGQAYKIPGADKTDEAKKTEKTDKAEKEEKSGDTTEKAREADEKEKFLDKYLKHTGDKMSKENDALNKDADKMSASAASLIEAIRRSDETGERDKDKMDKAAEDFVNTYNTFADTVHGSKNETVNAKGKLINDMLDAFEKRLEKVGIKKDEDGKLSLDKKELNKAEDKDLEKALGEKDSFTEFIEGQSKQLAAYAQTDLYQNASAYNDGGNITQISNISGSYFNMLG